MRLAEAGFKLKKFVTNSDELHFRVKANEQTTQKQDPAVGINPFFYPLGVISPVTVLFKMFFQCLCQVRVGWDAPFSGDLLREWNKHDSPFRASICLVVVVKVDCHCSSCLACSQKRHHVLN